MRSLQLQNGGGVWIVNNDIESVTDHCSAGSSTNLEAMEVAALLGGALLGHPQLLASVLTVAAELNHRLALAPKLALQLVHLGLVRKSR